ncbi:MAG TPA: hypothetical protein VEU72_06790 [Nitrosopumilaceae archaeon]|nr:hypothetical protein [Nitrosopumilaceae archaeon]
MKTSNLQKASFAAVSFLSLFAIHDMDDFFGKTDESSDEQYFLNISNYSYGSNDNSNDQIRNRLMKKTLVTSIIENALVNMGKGTYATVINQLASMQNCTLQDCFDHPEYLKGILMRHGFYIYNSIISSIKSKLKEFEYDKEIVDFMKGISE